jgi:hypothetical protein
MADADRTLMARIAVVTALAEAGHEIAKADRALLEWPVAKKITPWSQALARVRTFQQRPWGRRSRGWRSWRWWGWWPRRQPRVRVMEDSSKRGVAFSGISVTLKVRRLLGSCDVSHTRLMAE